MDKSVSASSASYIPMAVKSMTIFTIALMVIAIALVVIPGLATGGTAAAAGLDARYLETAKAEPDLDERDVFAAINRWTYDIYNTRSSAPGASGDGTTSSGVSGDGQAGSGVSDPGSPGGFSGAAALAYNWACLIDPVTAEIAAEWKKAMAGAETVAEKIAAIDAWNEQNMYHTQMTDYFKDMPGQDPWGVTLDGKPTFRKLLPSEMKAMTKLTGRISGKCMTLANLLAACLIHSGVRPDDIAIIHVQMPNFQHGAAIFNWDGEMARTNNHRMGMFYGTGGPPSFPPAPTPVIALYNSRFYNPGGFVSPAGCMDKGTFKADRALMPQVVTKCCGGVPIPEAA
ncbi:MAG TPA: hypothetical protein VLA34_11205, partial [Candidatus Krumholzibacterium sp.]|nr:hypothetical protein [Candidatus Krumholzibacterium sp.]